MFRAPCSSGGGGWVDGGWWLGGAPHTCVHACTCMHGKHDNFMQMATPIGGIPGNSLWCHTHVHACVHACACACGWGVPSHHPPPPRGTPGIMQNSIALELIEIFQFCLKIWNLETSLPMGRCIIWWVGWLVGSGQITKNLKIVDWIKIIQFCLKIYDLWRHPHPWVGVSGWVNGWVNGWCQVKWLKI